MSSAAVSKPSTQVLPGDWACSGCSANNFASRNECYSCKAAKPAPQQQKVAKAAAATPAGESAGHRSFPVTTTVAAPSTQVLAGDWACPECGANNFATRFECYSCKAAKPSATPTNQHNLPSSPKESGRRSFHVGGDVSAPSTQVLPGDWACSGCSANNFSSRNECYSCKAAKPAPQQQQKVAKAAAATPAGESTGHRSFPVTTSVAAPSTQVLAGDWACPECGANNFATRLECYSCKACSPAAKQASSTTATATASVATPVPAAGSIGALGSDKTSRQISELHPGMRNTWSICARVIEKESIKKVGKQEMFWCTLLDGTAVIDATFVNMPAGCFENVNVGGIYTFSYGLVFPTAHSRRKTSGIDHECCVSFVGHTSLISDEVDPSSSNGMELNDQIPHHRCHLVTGINTLPEVENHKLVDVLLVVRVCPAIETTSKGKKFRTLLVTDETATTDLTLWDDDAVNCDKKLFANTAYILHNVKVNHFAGGKSTRLVVSNLSAECIEVSRNDEENLGDRLALTRAASMKSASALPNISGMPEVARGHFNNMKPATAGASERMMEVLCVPTAIVKTTATAATPAAAGTTDLWFPTCSLCKKGIRRDGENNIWLCVNKSCVRKVKEANFSITPKEQFKLNLQLCDGTGWKTATLFDAVASRLFGMSAAELASDMKDGGEESLASATSQFLNRPCVMLLKVKYSSGTTVKDIYCVKATAYRKRKNLPSDEDREEFETITAFMQENESDNLASQGAVLEKKSSTRGKRDRDRE